MYMSTYIHIYLYTYIPIYLYTYGRKQKLTSYSTGGGHKNRLGSHLGSDGKTKQKSPSILAHNGKIWLISVRFLLDAKIHFFIKCGSPALPAAMSCTSVRTI